jgi:hypothetical protein
MPALASIRPTVRERVRAFGGLLRTARGQRWTRWGRWAVQAAVAVLLAVQLSEVGWTNLWRALPAGAAFYLLLVLHYALLPLAEAPIYTRRWGTGFGETFQACLRKRVYNDDLVGYVGEVYLVLWGGERGINRGAASRDVRDVNILSSVVSFAGTLAAAAWAVGAGSGGGVGSGHVLGLAALPLVALLVAVAVLGRTAFALPPGDAVRATVYHLARLFGTSAALVGMWRVAVPEISLGVWAAYLAAQLLVGRIPLLPGKDLLFVGAGVGMAGSLGVAEASVAGALLVQVVATKALNLVVLVGPSALRRLRGRPVERAGQPKDAIGENAEDLLVDALTGAPNDRPSAGEAEDEGQRSTAEGAGKLIA